MIESLCLLSFSSHPRFYLQNSHLTAVCGTIWHVPNTGEFLWLWCPVFSVIFQIFAYPIQTYHSQSLMSQLVMHLQTHKRFLRAAFSCQIETELGSNQLTAVSLCQKQRKWTGMHHTLSELCPLFLGCTFWQTHQPQFILVFQDPWLSLTVAVFQGIVLERGDSNLQVFQPQLTMYHK